MNFETEPTEEQRQQAIEHVGVALSKLEESYWEEVNRLSRSKVTGGPVESARRIREIVEAHEYLESVRGSLAPEEGVTFHWT